MDPALARAAWFVVGLVYGVGIGLALAPLVRRR